MSPSAPPRGPLGPLFLTVLLDLLGFGLVVPFLPGVARDLGASDLLATLLGAAYSLMQFLFIPLWGRLSDRVGRRPVLLWSIAATAGSMTLLGLAGNLPLLFLARLLGGAATANLAVAQAYVADVTTPETRARGMGMLGMAFGLGFIVGPFVGGELGRVVLFGREGPLAAFVAAGLSLCNLLWVYRALPESLPAHGDRAPAPGRARFGLRPAALRDALGAVPGLLPAIACAFLVTFFFSAVEVTFRLFSADAFAMSVAGTGRVFGFIGVLSALTQGGLIGRLTRRFGERALIGAGLLTLALGYALLGGSALLPGARAGAALAFAAMLLGAGAISVGNGLTVPTLSSYVSRQAGPAQQGLALGSSQSLSALARAAGPLAAGALYEYVHLTAPYFVGAAGFLLVALRARRLPPLAPAPAARASADAVLATPVGTT